MKHPSNAAKGVGLTALAGAIFGFFPVFTSLYVRFGGDTDSFNLYGFVISVVLMAAYLAVRRVSFRVPGRIVPYLLLAGVLNAATRILLTHSYLYLNVGIATTLHFLYPLFAALIGAAFFRDRMPLYKWAAFVAAMAGVSLFATGLDEGGTLRGIVLALASSVGFALYMLTTEKAHLAEMDPIVFVFYVSLVSTFGCAAMGLGTGRLIVPVPGRALAVLVLCAIFNNIVGFAAQQQGVRYLGAAIAALFSLLEPVFSSIFGAAILRQTMTLRTVAGIVIILLALVWIVLMDNLAAAQKQA